MNNDSVSDQKQDSAPTFEQPTPNQASLSNEAEAAFSLGLKPSDLFSRVLVFTILSIITLGIYRFWAKTHLRHLLWSSTKLKGDFFHYTGTPGELFKGYAIALLILLPLSIASTVFENFALDPDGGISPPIIAYNILYFMVLIFLFGFAIFSMMRYRLTRTTWRGVRFGASGKPLHYGGLFLLSALIRICSIGLLFPLTQKLLNTYYISAVRFGSASFVCGPSLNQFYKVWWKPALLFYGGAIVFLYTPISSIDSILLAIDNEVLVSEENDAFLFLGVVASIFAFLCCALTARAWYAAVEFRMLVENTKILVPDDPSDAIIARCSTPMKKLLVPYFLYTFGVLGLAGVVALLISLGGGHAFVGVLGVLFLLALPSIQWVVLKLPVLKAILAGMELQNEAVLETVFQRSKQGDPKIGEGVADVMDMGAL